MHRQPLRAAIIGLITMGCTCSGKPGTQQTSQKLEPSAILPSPAGASPSIPSAVAAVNTVDPEGSMPRPQSSPDIEAICARADADIRRKVEVATAQHPQDHRKEYLGELGERLNCRPAGREGAWAVKLTHLQDGRDSSGNPTLKGTWAVEFVQASGRTLPAFGPGDLEAKQGYFGGPTLRWIADIDRDGIAELAVAKIADFHEEESLETEDVLSVHNGAVTSFAPLKGMDVSLLRDVDHDGFADFVVEGSYAVLVHGLNDFFVDRPKMLRHGRPDLTWAKDDPVVRSFVLAQCAKASLREPYLKGDDLEGTVLSGGCARIYGVPGPTVANSIRKACQAPNFQIGWNGDGCEALAKAFLAPPPFVIRDKP